MTSSHNSQTNRLLGYPDEARLLIINADDFGRSQASNAATLRAITEGIVRSTSLMVPCPWALHAMRLLAEHPEVSFGVHLTVLCDVPHYRCAMGRWGDSSSPASLLVLHSIPQLLRSFNAELETWAQQNYRYPFDCAV